MVLLSSSCSSLPPFFQIPTFVIQPRKQQLLWKAPPFHQTTLQSISVYLPSCPLRRNLHKCLSQQRQPQPLQEEEQQQQQEAFQFERLFSNLNQATLKREPGSLSSAIFLVAGTTVGAGILAIPAVTQESGFLASAVTCILCWIFMVVTGLLIAEVNVNTMCELGSGGVSLVSMARRTLGTAGVQISCWSYIFIHYALLIAYVARSSNILTNFLGIPTWESATLFSLILGGICFFGSQRFIGAINGVLVFGIISTFAALVAVASGNLHFDALLKANFQAAPMSIPIIALSFVYQNVVPVLCTNLEGDLLKVRSAIVLGTGIPLGLFLIWNAVILGTVSDNAMGLDPIQQLRSSNGTIGPIVEVFSLLAIATSFIGFVLGLSDFLADCCVENAPTVPEIRNFVSLEMDDFSGFNSDEADKPTDVSQHFDCSDVFTTTQIFPTRDDLLYWAREVGKENNIVVVIVRSDTETGQRGRKTKVILGCERGGKYKSKSSKSSSSSKSTGSHKCECPFALKGRPLSTGQGWILKVLCGIHNHRIPESMMGHSFVGRLNQHEKEIVHDMTKNNVRPGNILLTLKSRNVANLTTISQIYNERHKFRSTQKGPRTEMQHLLNLIQRDRYVFWYRRHDGSDVVRDIFWTHPDAVNLLNTFHVVLFMDSTYKTNRYRLPLFEIVGVTSTSLTYTVAFAYLDSEQQDNFEWALLKLKGLFVRQESFPKVILTDRDLALMNAIASVFPTSANLLCQWHIGKNVHAKCKKLVFREDKHEEVKNAWDGVVDATDEFEYQQRLMTFEWVCSEFPIFVEYVKNTWLNPFKEKFVAAWTNRVMHFGNTTTNRAESAHWTLKRNLQNSRGDLCHCWEAMNNMLALQHTEIKASFERSINVVEHRHNNRLFIRLHGFVSRTALQLIADECSRANYVGIDKSACGCLIRTTHGLPCACELAGYIRLFAPIPLEAVHLHWRSLHFGEYQSQQHQVETEGGVSEEELALQWDALVNRFRSLNVIGKRTLFTKVRELVFPDTTSMCPPPQKVKTKGAPKRGKGKAPAMDGYDVRRDPSYFEHVDNMYSDLPSGNTSKASNVPSNVPTRKKKRSDVPSNVHQRPYLSQFPLQFRPYIEEIVDVQDDGNCGYRSIAALLGKSEDGWSIVRQDLEKEIRMHYDLYGQLFGDQYQALRESLLGVTGSCFRDKWMTLPEMGYAIATKYKVVLVSLNECTQTCWTFFPLRGICHPTQPNNALICIGFVNKNHWVQVFLKPGCPLPNVAPSWRRYCYPEANSWATLYAARLQEWFTLFPPLHHTTPHYPDDRVHLDDD